MKLRRRTIVIGVIAVLAAAGGGGAWWRYRRSSIKTVTAETVRARDLEALVSASGKIQPKRSVNVSADTMGRVTELAVNEGDAIESGQFLLQIDPRNLQTTVQRNEAGLAAARAQLEQLVTAVETARENLALARETLKRQRDLWAGQLTTREALDRAETEAKVRERDVAEREQLVATQRRRIEQESAVVAGSRYDLSKVRILSPIDGIVTRRNIELGETVVIGTMNNPGTVLLTIADMSVIEAEIEVDETDIPSLKIGQHAKVHVDAFPDRVFDGRVTEIGNSPIQAQATGAASATSQSQATNFKVSVQLDGQIPEVRPGFTCTADITTATRQNVVSVPIQSLTVRELVYDADGRIVRLPHQAASRSSRSAGDGAGELAPGQSRKEVEGVFVLRDGRAEFTPLKTGIAGERYFEVLSGLAAGDRVITGPFNAVRDLADGDPVREDTKTDLGRGLRASSST